MYKKRIVNGYFKGLSVGKRKQEDLMTDFEKEQAADIEKKLEKAGVIAHTTRPDYSSKLDNDYQFVKTEDFTQAVNSILENEEEQKKL